MLVFELIVIDIMELAKKFYSEKDNAKMSEILFNDRPRKNEKETSIDYVKTLIKNAQIENNLEDIPKLEKLIELLNSKKYGLVWEEHAERVEEEMKTKIPIFVEIEEKKSIVTLILKISIFYWKVIIFIVCIFWKIHIAERLM